MDIVYYLRYEMRSIKEWWSDSSNETEHAHVIPSCTAENVSDGHAEKGKERNGKFH